MPKNSLDSSGKPKLGYKAITARSGFGAELTPKQLESIGRGKKKAPATKTKGSKMKKAAPAKSSKKKAKK
jgi:hypothetical protein